ncbi:MAG: protein kinase [Planctomycetes bacterium]|nr:protein kinase [Planctomycetota bacterium]
MAGDVDQELGRIAIARGMLTRDAMEECLREARHSTPPRNLGQVLVDRGLATLAQMQDLLRAAETPARPSPAPDAGADRPRLGLTPGTSFGRYQILSQLGRGGMGAVYKALDPALNRTVALKLLSERHLATPDDVHRFQRESKLAARLRHPHLVAVYEAGILDGIPYYTMEFVEGRTLDELLVEELTGGLRMDERPRLSREDKLRLMIRVAEAVHVAHRAGIIHRDLKPANIIVDDANEPHVMDFGLAKEVTSVTFLTSTGMAIGTPNYMPPEQARGAVRDLDPRTDVYALGAVLYHALTLKLPFMEATAPAVLRKVLDEDPVPPRLIEPTVDRPLERVILKAMAKEARERYPTAGDFARDLERYLAGQDVSARGPSLRARARRWIRRHPAWAASAAVSLLLGVVFALFFLFRPGQLTIQTDPPGAEVWIDGRRGDALTPIKNLSLSRGRHEVRLILLGYRSVTLAVDIGPGAQVVRKEQLDLQSGSVSLVSDPPDTEVRLYGPQSLILRTPVERLALPDGTYRAEFFRPQYELAWSDMVVRDRADVRREVRLRSAQRWAYKTGDGVHPELVAADLNGDSVPDIVAGSKDQKLYAISGRTGQALWPPHDTRHVAQSRPVLVYLDRDTQPDIVFGVGASGFLCLRGKDGAALFFVKTGLREFVGTAALDVNGDRVRDLFVADSDGKLNCWSGKALLALKPDRIWSRDLGARPVGSPWVGAMGIVAVTEGRRVVVVSPAGREVRSWGVPAPVSAWAVDESVGDLFLAGGGQVSAWSLIDGRCRWSRAVNATPTAIAPGPDVAVATEEGMLLALTAEDGSERWRYQADQAIRGRPLWVDLDLDGRKELVFGSDDRRLYALDASGRRRWYYQASDSVASSPITVDLTGDGVPEVVFGSNEGHIRAVAMAGRSSPAD